MPTTFVIDEKSHLHKTKQTYVLSERIQNYIDGFNALNHILIKKNIKWDCVVMDNSCSFEKLPKELQNAINKLPNIQYIDNTEFHVYGKINKGSGIIEQYKQIKHIFKHYDKILHFEPRQLLNDTLFFDKFLENPKPNYFKVHSARKFNTGLFLVSKDIWMKYINQASPKKLADTDEQIEKDLFVFFKANNYTYERTKLGLIWVRPGWENLQF